jgi:hypothetical protein
MLSYGANLPKRVLSDEYTVRCNKKGKIYPIRSKHRPNATAATARPSGLLYTYTTELLNAHNDY